MKIINWLTVPTAVANLINAVGGLFFAGQLLRRARVTRLVGIAIIAVALPLLWWRFRHDDRDALTGIAWSMLIVVVLFVPAALPWYYTWPLAVMSPLAQSRRAVAAIAGFSTWIMVIFKPDGSHGMYSWIHVCMATACALVAWYALRPASRRQNGRTGQYAMRLRPAHHFASLVRVQRVDRTGVRELLAGAVAGHGQRRVRGEQPPHDLGVAVAAVVQHRQQPGQAFDHVTGVGEEDLRHHHDAAAAHRDQVAVAQLLMHLA